MHLSQLGTTEFPPLSSLGQGIVSLPLAPDLAGRAETESIEEVRTPRRPPTGWSLSRASADAARPAWPSRSPTVRSPVLPRGRLVRRPFDHRRRGCARRSGGQRLVTVDLDGLPTCRPDRHLLAPREALLVVDNCEHVIDSAAELVDRLLEQCPGLRIMATSRESLEVDGEYTWKVPSLAIGDRRPRGSAFLRAGRRGRRRRASTTRRAWRTSPRSSSASTGSPSPSNWPPPGPGPCRSREIRDLLDDRFSLLSGGARRSRQRQATLEGAVQWSYDLLRATSRPCCGPCRSSRAGFSVPDVAAVAGCAEHDARELVDALAAKSLVDVTRDAPARSATASSRPSGCSPWPVSSTPARRRRRGTGTSITSTTMAHRSRWRGGGRWTR